MIPTCNDEKNGFPMQVHSPSPNSAATDPRERASRQAPSGTLKTFHPAWDCINLACSWPTSNLWLHSSISTASLRYHGGHGFESRWSHDFNFQKLLEHPSGGAEITGLNPVQARIVFFFFKILTIIREFPRWKGKQYFVEAAILLGVETIENTPKQSL